MFEDVITIVIITLFTLQLLHFLQVL